MQNVFASNGYVFVISPNLQEAQKHIASLRLEKGKAFVDAERKANKFNQAVYLFDNYIDFYQNICLQKKSDFEAYEKAKSGRINAFKKLDASNPYKLFGQAEIYIQSAFLKGMNEEYIGAAWDFKSCYQLLMENQKLFPSFIANKKDIGMLKAILGTIPDSYRWVVSIAGMKADLNEGVALLKEYIETADDNEILMERKNAQYFYTAFNLNFSKNKPEAWKIANKYTSDYKTNLLSACIRAFAAKGTDNNEACVNALNERPTGNDYVGFPYLEMMHGSALLQRLDLSAMNHIKKFIASNKDPKDNKEAYLKLSWCAWLKNDTVNYQLYRNISLNISNKGEKNVLASSGGNGFYPEKTLLKVRLLFDGGNFAQALQMMEEKPIATFLNEREKVEYTYRLGRIYHETNKLSKAIEFYDLTIKRNFKENEYLAANACLQLGFIYQKLKYNQLAKTFFNKVFEYKNYDYKNYLQQQAKAAIAKL